jgi:nucleoside-diphosphate-sugar epimerase
MRIGKPKFASPRWRYHHDALCLLRGEDVDSIFSLHRGPATLHTPSGTAAAVPAHNVKTQLDTTQSIQNVAQLEQSLSEPSRGVIETVAALDGDFIVLGAAGKMGPSLTRMIHRALDAAGLQRRVIAVSRFSSRAARAELDSHGIETIECDLLDEDAVQQLPDAANVVYLAGMKFGSTGQEALTWAMNSFLPAIICKKFRRSRIVAFSTGNVYGMTPVDSGGSRESDPPAPAGEYAMSCLGRERMFEYFSRKFAIPAALIRLNYACDLRYGVLVDLARQVWNGDVINLAMGHFNTIWQGDANAVALQAFSRVTSPPVLLNVTGPETLAVREVCERFGKWMNREPRFTGTESATALLSNSRRSDEWFGPPRVSTGQLIRWVADWIMRGGPLLGKPTHFESRDGKF